MISGKARDGPVGLPLTTWSVPVAGRTWRIRAAADHDALLAASERLAVFPFGLLLWESAVALAAALAGQGGLTGRTVLELGCGVGLAGLVARSLGARVTQTDHSPEALALARANAGQNGADGIETFLGDWRNWQHEARHDLILGADILYERDLHMTVLAILEHNLAAGGRVLLADPGRPDTPAFLAAMRAAGWRVETTTCEVPQLVPAGPGGPVMVTLISARRLAGPGLAMSAVP